MVTDTLTVFRNSFLTLKSSALGRLVTDARNPSQDFWPKIPPTLSDVDFDVRPFEALRSTAAAYTDVGFAAKLSRLFSGNVSRERSSFEGLQADSLLRYLLLQPRTYFTTMCADNETRRWMESALRDCPLFLIVGLVTLTDANVHKGQQGETQGSLSTEAPVGEALTGGALAADPGGAANAGVDVHDATSSVGSSSFRAPGERVVAVQYRKVKFTLLQKRNTDNASLERNPNRWVMFLGGDRASEDDVIEADLEDEITADDLEYDIGEDLVIAGSD